MFHPPDEKQTAPDHPPVSPRQRIESDPVDDRRDPMPDTRQHSSGRRSTFPTLKHLLLVALGLMALGGATLVASDWLYHAWLDVWSRN